jgi:hypothetical protein
MLIDPISIHYSNAVAHTVVTNPTQIRFIHAWRDLLVSVGWTEVQGIRAKGSITFPLGAPITRGVTVLPKTVIGCNAFPGFLAIGDQSFTLYDPFTEIPASLVTCEMVEMGLTFGATLQNVTDAITATTPWDAVLVVNSTVSFTINLTAKIGGPDFNYVNILASGFASGIERTSGGGYRLESAPGAAVYQCAVTDADTAGAIDNYLAGNLLFDFTLNGQHMRYQLLDASQGTRGFMGQLGVGGVGEYTIIANPYGFAVFDQPRNVTTRQFRAVSIFAMAPYFPGSEVPPTEQFVDAYAVFIVGPNQIGGPSSWNNPYMAPSSMCLDGSPFTAGGYSPCARLLAYRSPGPPLRTPKNVPLTTGCYVMFGSSVASIGWVVGKLWDCALVSDTLTAGAIIDGRKFLVLGGSDGSGGLTQCTLLMACGEEYTDIPAPPLPPPPPLAAPKTGTVNLFGDGVTWLSGDVFTADMEGKPITIGGESYVVLAFVDSTHLTLTQAKTIAAGATYSAP